MEKEEEREEEKEETVVAVVVVAPLGRAGTAMNGSFRERERAQSCFSSRRER